MSTTETSKCQTASQLFQLLQPLLAPNYRGVTMNESEQNWKKFLALNDTTKDIKKISRLTRLLRAGWEQLIKNAEKLRGLT